MLFPHQQLHEAFIIVTWKPPDGICHRGLSRRDTNNRGNPETIQKLTGATLRRYKILTTGETPGQHESYEVSFELGSINLLKALKTHGKR